MLLNRPKFWQTRNILAYCFLPFSFIYLLGFKLKALFAKQKNFHVPIICVGNIVLGGTGKTPFILKLIELLKSNYNIAVISKGYGGKFTEICRKVADDTAEIVGDEPLLLAEKAVTYVTKDRKVAIKEAIKNGADLIILDDGFQDNTVKKTMNFLCFDGEYGVGNGFLIPAGPLREKYNHKMLDAAIIIGLDKRNISKFIKNQIWKLNFHLKNDLDKEQRYLAFAGIGNPDKFFNFLKRAELQYVDRVVYPDHYQYSEEDLEQLLILAKKKTAQLLTTKKDFVRIPKNYQKHVKFADVELKFAKNDTEFKKYLFDLIKNK